jgi:hypothetical protein
MQPTADNRVSTTTISPEGDCEHRSAASRQHHGISWARYRNIARELLTQAIPLVRTIVM